MLARRSQGISSQLSFDISRLTTGKATERDRLTEDEIEVTPAMIAAGEDVFWEMYEELAD
ncbi:MAG: hypothetical protein JOY71_00100 [Acetobacteraceae bacterium]|nr:hypothetical protein [Acetobacteraceae bacterium]